MSQGLTEAGINVIAGVDIWQTAINSYSKNFTRHAICADLTKLSPAEFDRLYNGGQKAPDFITMSPPCQFASIAGKRDINDPRGMLFEMGVDYLDYYKPRAFMMENVIGLLSMKQATGGLVIDVIMEKFNREYNTVICKLYASDYGVPQNRRRVIIIGIRKDLNILPSPPPTTTETARPSVGSVLQPRESVDKSYYLSARALEGIRKKKERSKLRGVGFGAQFLDLSKPSYTIPARYWKDGYDALVKYNEGEAIVGDVRRLTILELKRIQSFPDDYNITGSRADIITQIGNAVACKLGFALGKYLTALLN